MLQLQTIGTNNNGVTIRAHDDTTHQRFSITLDVEMLTHFAKRAAESKGKKCREAGGALEIKHVGDES